MRLLEKQNVIIEKAVPAEIEHEGEAVIPVSTSGPLDRLISEIVSLKVRDWTHSFTIA